MSVYVKKLRTLTNNRLSSMALIYSDWENKFSAPAMSNISVVVTALSVRAIATATNRDDKMDEKCPSNF